MNDQTHFRLPMNLRSFFRAEGVGRGDDPMNHSQLPPIRIDSPRMDARTLAREIDWDLRDLAIPDIWKWYSGAGVLVILLDTGVPQHVDLPPPIFTHNVSDSSTQLDHHGHQTHCAGIVAGQNDNDGVVGWAPEVTLGHIKVLGDEGNGCSSWLTHGIKVATQEWKRLRSDFVGCVICVSTLSRFDADQQEALIAANEAGALVVAPVPSRKNRFGKFNSHPIGASAYTIGVAAYRRNVNFIDVSYAGPEVDIVLPGDRILSTSPGNLYQFQSGISMATHSAAGLLACILSSRPNDQKVRDVRGMRDFVRQHGNDREELANDSRLAFGVPAPGWSTLDTDYWFF